MPIQPTYPGVYIEELPSGVHTITGVATSITAFVGAAPLGPVNEPTTVTSYADFERSFGGLWASSTLGYAVQDFFANGGSTAIIVRLFSPDLDNNSAPINDVTKLTVGGLTLAAASAGAWGNHVAVKLDHNVTPDHLDAHGNPDGTYDPNAPLVFNLTAQQIVNGRVMRTETFRNLTVADGPRRIDKVLAAGSQLVSWDSAAQPLPSQPAETAATNAMQPIIPLQNALIAAQRAKPPNPQAVKTAQQNLQQGLDTLNQQNTTTTANDGQALKGPDFAPVDGETDKVGVFALEKADLFNILCIPPYLGMTDIDLPLLATLAEYCVKRRAMLLVDAPSDWLTTASATVGLQDIILPIGSDFAKNVAIYFPRLLKTNLLTNQIETYVSSGAVAGVYARTDAERGVWKAPAGTQASIAGLSGLSVPLTDGENGLLNPLGINCLRIFPATGAVIWGARTLAGDDRLASEWKYVPIRRTALFIEESLYRGLQWVVFEPNDEPLWAQIRLNVGAFMHNLFRQGAFQGQTPTDAYLVKCDSETTTQNDRDLGMVNILVGFAPLKPAEFVIIQIQQLAGQIQV